MDLLAPNSFMCILIARMIVDDLLSAVVVASGILIDGVESF